MKRKKVRATRTKVRARASKKSLPKDKSFSRLALILLILLTGLGFWLYYNQSVKDKEPPEAKIQSLIIENPDAEVLEMEEEGSLTNQATNGIEDESVPEVFRMAE